MSPRSRSLFGGGGGGSGVGISASGAGPDATLGFTGSVMNSGSGLTVPAGERKSMFLVRSHQHRAADTTTDPITTGTGIRMVAESLRS